MSTTPTIIPAGTQHLDTIVENNRAMARETEGLKLDSRTLRAGVASVLEDQNKGRYFLALDGAEQVMGQTMVTFEWSDWRCGWIWWLQSVYVARPARRAGVFGALLEHIIAQAQAEQVRGLRLYVEQENARAIAAYVKYGFGGERYRMLEKMFSP